MKTELFEQATEAWLSLRNQETQKVRCPWRALIPHTIEEDVMIVYNAHCPHVMDYDGHRTLCEDMFPCLCSKTRFFQNICPCPSIGIVSVAEHAIGYAYNHMWS